MQVYSECQLTWHEQDSVAEIPWIYLYYRTLVDPRATILNKQISQIVQQSSVRAQKDCPIAVGKERVRERQT